MPGTSPRKQKNYFSLVSRSSHWSPAVPALCRRLLGAANERAHEPSVDSIRHPRIEACPCEKRSSVSPGVDARRLDVDVLEAGLRESRRVTAAERCEKRLGWYSRGLSFIVEVRRDGIEDLRIGARAATAAHGTAT